jgi:oligopeptide/dipeptide ABC transporter ATP-binding protein
MRVEVEGLHVSYPSRRGWTRQRIPALRDVSLTVAEGETLAIVGESGSGKSTLGKAILRLVPVDAGRIRVGGRDIATLSDRALRPLRLAMQMVFQDPYLSLNPRKTVAQILGAALGQAGTDDPAGRTAALLQAVGLPAAMATRRPRSFSGGQRQRIGIARALATRPRLIIADEPVSALDVSVRAQVINLLADLTAREGLTLVFISHDLGVVRHIADRVAVMYFGQIVETAPNAAFYAAPAHHYSAALLSAVPAPDPALARAALQTTLPGEIPSPLRPPAGCAFHSRCPRAAPRCATEPPALRPLAPGREVACHFPLTEPRDIP